MITLGTLILLFVAYQLWGTNLAEARAQDSLRQEFRTIVGEPDPSKVLPPAPEGEAVAVLKMPNIDIEKVVVEGVGVSELKEGPGHYPGTPLPGQPGNSAIAGHRTTDGAPFNQMDKMKVGDPVIISTQPGPFLLDNTPDNRLTITTCHPRYSLSQRLVLVAELKGPAAAPSPETKRIAVKAEENLSGDPSARLPAILWGLAAGAVWLAAYLVGRRWRKWPHARGSLARCESRQPGQDPHTTKRPHPGQRPTGAAGRASDLREAIEQGDVLHAVAEPP
jgi:sortase A